LNVPPTPETAVPPPDAAAPAAPLGDGDRAFRMLLAAGGLGSRCKNGVGLGIDETGRAIETDAGDPRCLLVRRDGRWHPADGVSAQARAVLDLYLPIRPPGASGSITVAHLGQSLDGQIAAASGDSYYVTGPANLLHLQRMRALCDAVVVGAETVATDDPRLTVRSTAGETPVRVVLDPRRRLDANRRVFGDGEAPTLLVAAEDRVARQGERHGLAEVVGVPVQGRRLVLAALLETLHKRGLRRVFVEGGGTTVSGFLEAGLLDRLHIAVAPLVTGRGRPGLVLVERDRLCDGLRPAHRVFCMGADVLFDCDLRAAPSAGAELEPRRVL